MAQENNNSNETDYTGTEQPFALDLVVHIRGYGHKDIEAAKMIGRVCREIHLLFGDRAEVEQLGQVRAVQFQQHKVEPKKMPKVDSQEVLPGLSLTPFITG